MKIDELIAREQIRHTIASYNRSGDADDPDGFADCFTTDAILDTVGFHHEGRENIRAWKTNNRVFAGGSSGRSASFRVHHVSSVHITFLNEERARSRSPFFVITEIGPDHSGVYHDIFRRVEDRWLIERRVIDVLWRADNSFISPDFVGCRSATTRLLDV